MPSSEREPIYSYLPTLSYCGDFIIRGDWELGPRANDDFEVVYFPAGSKSSYSYNGINYELDSPCFIFTPPGEEHAYYFDAGKPIRHLFAHFVLETDADSEVRSIPPVTKAESVPHLAELMKQIVYITSHTPIRWRERTSSLLRTVIEELASSDAEDTYASARLKTVPIQISKAAAYIEEHLHEPIAIKELASKVGWAHEYFTRVFVQTKGVSPIQYILHRRIDRACDILKFESSSIKEIAYFVGFKSEQYFCRAFTKIVGMSASKYRDKYKDPRINNLHLAPTGQITAPYPLNRYFYFT